MTKRMDIEYEQKTLNQELSNTIVAKKNGKTNDELLKKYFDNDESIGFGAFGQVSKILMKDKKNQTKLGLNEEMAAIKICSEFSFFSIVQEAKIISLGIHHPNIVEFKSFVRFRYNTLIAHRFEKKSNNDSDDESEISQMKVNSSLIAIGIVMELLPGFRLGVLASRLPSFKFSEKQAKSIFEQIGSALAYLHYEHGVTHRDLHNGNIMTTQKFDLSKFNRETEIGLVKLIDFGLAKRYDKKTTEQYHKEPWHKLPEDCPFMDESRRFGILISSLCHVETEFDPNNNSLEALNLSFQSILSRLSFKTQVDNRLKLFEALDLTKKL